jgi:nucleotide-binding universal stress UspA family protein
MMKALAALDNSLSAKTVLANAGALASLAGAELEAVHVRVDGGRTALGTAEAAGVPLRALSGDLVEQLLAAARADDVIAVAVGARGSAMSRRPLGGVALAVAGGLPKPVLVVPPEAEARTSYRRILLPLEGTVEASEAVESILELARSASVAVLVLHVFDQESVPAFSDQPQHEHPAREREFLHRHVPGGLHVVELETRVGRSGELIPAVAETRDCDLIALVWSQELSAGRAPVVRETLERSRRPILLVPIQHRAD